MPNSSIPVNIRVLFLEPCHAEDHIVVGNISDDEVNHMALLCFDTIAYLYRLLYDSGSAQQFTIDSSDRGRSLFLDLAPSCPDCLKSELIHDGLGDEVVGGAQVDERQIGVISLAAWAFAEVHRHHKVQWWQRGVLVGVIFARRGQAQCRRGNCH